MNAAPANQDQTPPAPGLTWPDLAVGLLLALAAAIGIWSLAGRVPTAVLDPRNPDIYFSSDISRVQENMLTRDSNHFRTSVHPLFSLESHPAFLTVATVTGADLRGGPLSPGATGVGRLMSGIAAGLAAAALFAFLRTALIRRFDAVVFCLLAGSSAFALFWFTVPETYPWGSVTILAALLLAGVTCHRQLSAGWYLAANVLSLSVTTTNWMAGLFATAARFSWPKTRAALLETAWWTAKVMAITLAVTLALALVQKAIFPSSRLFIRFGGERAYVMQQESGGPVRCLASIFSHTLIMPEVTTAPHSHMAGQTVLRTQMSAPGSASIWGKVALACWVPLLAAGLYALVTLPGLVPLRLTLGLTLLGQVGLHTIYGAETFLYAAHYGPIMIALAALATRTRLRPAVLLLAVIMLGCLVLNNFPQFDRVMEFLAQSQHRLDLLPP